MIEFTYAAGLLLLLVAFLIVPGLVLLVRHRPRYGTAPHCRRCDYLLVGNTSAVCPECGLALTPGNIVPGNRLPVTGIRIAGAFLVAGGLFIASIVAAPAARSYDWYRLRPDFWVVRDAKSTRSPAHAIRAWKELDRRLAAGQLSESHRSALVQFALDEQANANSHHPPRPPHPALPDLLDHLGDQCATGRLTDAQVKRFFDNGFRLTIVPRPVVAAGDRFPVHVGIIGNGPGRGWWTRAENRSITLGGKTEFAGAAGAASFQSFGHRSVGTHDLAPRPPGEYPLTAAYQLRIYHGPPLDQDRSRLVYERTVTGNATVRAVPRGEAPDLQLLDSPEILPAMRAALAVREFAENAPPSQGYRLLIAVRSPPENVAFDVFVRFDGNEHPVRTITVRKGQQLESHTGIGLSKFTKPPSNTADIIFRSNEKLARETIDLFQIWSGEIVIKDVPITRPR